MLNNSINNYKAFYKMVPECRALLLILFKKFTNIDITIQIDF